MKNLFLFLTITLIKINFLFAQPSSDLSILLNKNESFQGSFNQIVFDNQGQIIKNNLIETSLKAFIFIKKDR